MSATLEIVPHTGSALEWDGDVLLVPLFQDGELSGLAAEVDARLEGVIREMRSGHEFGGEAYQVQVLPTLGRLPSRRVALVGLGKRGSCTATVVKQAFAAAARTLGKKELRVALAEVSDLPLPAEEAAIALVEGAVLARYIPDPYRTGERRDTLLGQLRVSGASEAALAEGRARGEAKNFARDLVNEPANVLTPEELARRALAMASEVGLESHVLDEAKMEELGMGAILAVTRGSEEPAQFIILRHHGAPEAPEGAPLLALVGKAVCFDTGGISIKPAADMGKMKGDMAGGAAVVGAMRAIAALKIPANVIGLVPAVINRPDGRAWLPGDVITTMAGKTVETLSTDAEGRMLLADGVHYARTLGATHIVDIATLTGACAVALGGVASGLWSTDDALRDAVVACGAAAGERHWPMPLFPEYREQIRSEIGDLKNSGGRMGGANTAAIFIREFAVDTPWAHLDIAGAGSSDKPKPWAPAGPTGTGVGTFINLARHFAEKSSGGEG